jgi:hypothetical protein
MKKSFFLRSAVLAFVGIVATLTFDGCRSSGTGPRDLMSDEVRSEAGERPVAMRGDGSFLGGKLVAFATVSRGFDRGARKQGSPGERGGRRRRDNDFSDDYPISFGETEEEQKEAMEEYIRQVKAVRARGSPMPPVTLDVLLENRGTESMEVVVNEVNSDLGNFAVRPPKLTLAPGEKGRLEPMISQLGVTSDEIPLKIGLRVGDKVETQVITVKNVLAASLRK